MTEDGKCPKCHKEYRKEMTFTEEGCRRARITPDDQLCVAFDYHNEHQAEVTVYLH